MSNSGTYDINIIVSTNAKGGQGVDYNYTNKADTSSMEQSGDAHDFKMYVAGMVQQQAVSIGRQALSFAVSNYGNWTGDYVTQANLETVTKIVGTASELAVAAVVGGVPGFIVAVAAKAVSYGFKTLGGELERVNENRRISVLRERVGTSIGGSR